MRRIVWGLIAFILVVGCVAIAGAYAFGQRPDYAWRPAARPPAYQGAGPVVLVDEGHNNVSNASFFGAYHPFARLISADGYTVRRAHARFAESAFSDATVLVVANAAGAPKAQFWGFNLPAPQAGDRSASAFTAAEIEAVRQWVFDGGSLLLVADHAPFGSASASLAAAFGVTMHRGFTEIPGEGIDPIVFDRARGRLGDHPILDGAGGAFRIERVMTFTGQSLSAPAGASVLLRLPPGSMESTPSPAGDAFIEAPAGDAQGVALEYGRGRVVVLGEAAMLTAQVSNGEPFGMNLPGNDNEAFALNVMHWLSRRL